jgi:hypothetical protein
MRAHRAGPKQVAKWTGLPEGLVHQIASGAMALMPPALLTIVLKLAGEVRVTIGPSAR